MVLVPQPGAKPVPPAREVRFYNHLDHPGSPVVAAILVFFFFFLMTTKSFMLLFSKSRVSLLLDFRLGHVTCFGQGDISQHITNRGLKTACLL